MNPGRQALGVGACAALAAGAVALRLLVVRVPGDGWAIGWPDEPIAGFRFGAATAAAAAGAALGASGAILQGVLRNPLASPFVLGVTSGAGAGVAIVALLASIAGAAAPADAALAAPATIGALAALAATLALARRNGSVDPTTLVLGGVIVGAVCAAITTVAEAMLPPDRRGLLMGWMFGRIPEMPDVTALRACVLAGLAVAGLGTWWGRALDAASMSDDEARSVGVNLGLVRTVLLAACGTATATTVVLCGPIAFVGLLAPHLARGLVGATHRALVPASAATGCALLVGADALRQWIDVGTGRLPLGALTAALGGIAFLILLRRTAGAWGH
jgi:iron complex transport system permease protein